MMEAKKITLADMKNGEKGVVKELLGGGNFARRLRAMGIREGIVVQKQGGMILKGPITVQVGGTQLGIGHGMAIKIVIEVEK